METSGTARHKEPVDELSRSYTPVSATTSPTMDLMIRIPAVDERILRSSRADVDVGVVVVAVIITVIFIYIHTSMYYIHILIYIYSIKNTAILLTINKMGRRTLFLQSFPRSVSEGSTAWLS